MLEIIRGNYPADLSGVVPAKVEENMADRLNFQDAVLRVVENLHSLNRHQPAPPGRSNSAVSATVTDELNGSFQIPRR